jgi:hypothetical protein
MRHKVNRNLKHVSVIACLSAAHVREQLKKHGVRFGTDFLLKGRAKPYINDEIFLKYIRMVFLPNLNELRSLEQFADEDAV